MWIWAIGTRQTVWIFLFKDLIRKLWYGQQLRIAWPGGEVRRKVTAAVSLVQHRKDSDKYNVMAAFGSTLLPHTQPVEYLVHTTITPLEVNWDTVPEQTWPLLPIRHLCGFGYVSPNSHYLPSWLCICTHTDVILGAAPMSVQPLHSNWHQWDCLHRLKHLYIPVQVKKALAWGLQISPVWMRPSSEQV